MASAPLLDDARRMLDDAVALRRRIQRRPMILDAAALADGGAMHAAVALRVLGGGTGSPA